MGSCAGGLVVTLLVTRPLTAGVLASGAAFAVAFPIGWLFATSGLMWALTIPFDPWVDRLILEHRPLPLAAKLAVAVGELNWAPAIAYGITLPPCWCPTGGCARAAGGRWSPPPRSGRWSG
jgi:hypothetical protein